MKTDLPYIIFELEQSCQLDCLFCYNIWKNPLLEEHTFKKTSYKENLEALKMLLKAANVRHITFSGGEPLLAERFEELVLFCRLRRIECYIISNGFERDQNRWKSLVDLGVALFELPIHSAQAAIHDQLSRKKGSFDNSVSNIRLLKSIGANVVGVSVLTRLNIKQIEETIRYMHQLGIKRIMLNRFNIGGEGVQHSEKLSPDRDELQQCFKTADKISSELNISISSNVCTPACILNPNDFKHIKFSECSVRIENKPLTLDSKGNLRICNHSPYHEGNIFTDLIETILKKAAERLSDPDFPAECKDCSFLIQCTGGCRAAAAQAGQSFNKPDPVFMLKKTKK